MKKLCLIMTLFMAQASYASDTDLSITAVDNTGFTATLINAGDLSVIMALTEMEPTIVIEGPETKINGKMFKIGEEIYQFEFTPHKKGAYLVKVMSGDATEELNLDVN